MTSGRNWFQKWRPWIVLVGALLVLAVLYRLGWHHRTYGSHHHY